MNGYCDVCRELATFKDDQGEFCDEHIRIEIILSEGFFAAWLIKNGEKQQNIKKAKEVTP